MGTLLFHTWVEGLALWNQVTSRFSPHTLVVIPDHVHCTLRNEDERRALATALRAFPLWRHAARGGAPGPVWEHGTRAVPIKDAAHLGRTRRYILLNPCRAGLVADPLAWPLSTRRDAVGLTLAPVQPPVRDAQGLHGRISGDPSVAVLGTELPPRDPVPPADGHVLSDVLAAVSALRRVPLLRLYVPGPARDLALRSARVLTSVAAVELAAQFGVHPSTARRQPAPRDGAVKLVERVCGDLRSPTLLDGDLRSERMVRRYRDLL